MDRKNLREIFLEIFPKSYLSTISIKYIEKLIERTLIDYHKLQKVADDTIADVEDLEEVLSILNAELNSRISND